MCALNCPRGLGCRRGSWPKCGHVGFSQKGYHFFGQPDPPPQDMLSSPQTPYTGGLRAFGATRVCHMVVTGGPRLTEKVVPSEPVADTLGCFAGSSSVFSFRSAQTPRDLRPRTSWKTR